VGALQKTLKISKVKSESVAKSSGTPRVFVVASFLFKLCQETTNEMQTKSYVILE